MTAGGGAGGGAGRGARDGGRSIGPDAAGHCCQDLRGYGFSRAMWQSFEHVRHLDIRGICDDGSEKKDDRWHKYAAAAAANFAKHFLLDRPLKPRKGAVPPGP